MWSFPVPQLAVLLPNERRWETNGLWKHPQQMGSQGQFQLLLGPGLSVPRGTVLGAEMWGCLGH